MKIQNGRSISFDKLLIASGADPRPIKAVGLDYRRHPLFIDKKTSTLPGDGNLL